MLESTHHRLCDAEYAKNRKLRKEDVQLLQNWIEKQQHLPNVAELELILFLHSCYFSIESAKSTLDRFYTMRTHFPEISTNTDPRSSAAATFMDIVLFTPLPQRTPKNHIVWFVKLLDSNADNFCLVEQLKHFDMCMMSSLMQEGTDEGIGFLVDIKEISFKHVAKIGLTHMKKFAYYVQDAMPIRLREIHFINATPVVDMLLGLLKPFLRNAIVECIYVHSGPLDDGVFQFIPRDCLPEEYGGSAGTITDLHGKMKNQLVQNAPYFERVERQIVDEKMRPGKPKTGGEIFGVEGSFRKLEID